MASERVAVEVVGVYQHTPEGEAPNHFVLFRDKAKRRMPISIGQFEAWSISLGLEKQSPDRPFTFDAMLTCLTALGAIVEEVYINLLVDDTFYSVVTLREGEAQHIIDMRPSDAINLALRAKCPIFINAEVMEKSVRK